MGLQNGAGHSCAERYKSRSLPLTARSVGGGLASLTASCRPSMPCIASRCGLRPRHTRPERTRWVRSAGGNGCSSLLRAVKDHTVPWAEDESGAALWRVACGDARGWLVDAGRCRRPNCSTVCRVQPNLSVQLFRLFVEMRELGSNSWLLHFQGGYTFRVDLRRVDNDCPN